MATDAHDEPEDLTLEHDAADHQAEHDAPEGDDDEPHEHAGDDDGEGEASDDDELEISFGEDPAPRGGDSDLIKHIRDENRRLAKEAAELRKQLAPAPKVVVGEKPTLEGCDYDADKFEADLIAWQERKRQADDEAAGQQRAQQQAQQQWQDELAAFNRKKAALKVKDFDASLEVAASTLSEWQQAAIVKGADDGAKVVYALGKHPAKLAELAKITDPVKFVAAIVKLEGGLKVTSRKNPPAPDRSVRGSAPMSATSGKVDAHLEKLEREASRTNDRSAVVAYKRQLRLKATR